MPLPWLFPVIFGAGGASLPDDITTIGWRLEFSPDDLSVANADATRIDVTSLLKKGTLRWTAGGQTLGEGPKAGEMSFTLLGRDFEPHYAASPRYPNVLRKRRFFISYGVGASFQDEFVGYARTFQPVWPGNVTHQEIDVVCGDGFDIIGDNRLPSLDPPEATTHGEVLAFDEPSFQYALGERGGTKVVSHTRKRKRGKNESKQHYKRHRVRRWKTRETRPEAEGIAGPPGTFKNTPLLGQPGGVLGDAGTSVLFRGEQLLRGTPAHEYARIPLDGETELGDVGQLTIVALAKLALPPAGVCPIVSGPNVPALSQSSFRLSFQGDRVQFTVRLIDGTSKSVSALFFPPTGEWLYIAARWNGDTGARSVLVYDTAGNVESGDNDMAFGELRRGDPQGYIYLNRDAEGNYGDQWLQHVAIYEEELPLERIEAQVDSAFFRGYPQQTAGERIAAAAASPLWNESNLVVSPFTIVPAMKVGQSPQEVIEEAMGAEGVRSIFGFRPNGDPFYLPWEWLAADDATVQLLVGSPRDESEGEDYFADQDLHYDDTVWNEATVSRDGGEAQTASDAASIEDFGPSSAEPVTGLANASDEDVALLAQEVVALYAEPTWMLERVDLHGGDEAELEALLTIGIGDLVRYRRRSYDDTAASMGEPIDVVAHVLGYEKRWEASNQVTGTLYLARGFAATDDVWRMGVDGFSEMGETTTLA